MSFISNEYNLETKHEVKNIVILSTIFSSPAFPLYKFIFNKDNKTLTLASERLTFNFNEIKDIKITEEHVGAWGIIRSAIILVLENGEKIVKMTIPNYAYGQKVVETLKKEIC